MSYSPDIESDSTIDDPEETYVEVNSVATQTKKTYPCDICNEIFLSRNNMNHHIRQLHPEQYVHEEPKRKIYSCEYCQKAYACKKYFTKHLKIQHNICRNPKVPSNEKKHKCDICGSSFVSNSTLRRHKKNVHKKQLPTKYKYCGCFKCSECQSSFKTKTSYFEHIIVEHDKQLNVETMRFDNEADFESWKSSVEKKTVSYFRKDRKCIRNDLLHTSYICHRSGFFVSKNTGKRRLKTGGSLKIDCFCPASISVKATSAGKPFPVEVNFISSHFGHDFEIGKLRIKQRQRYQQVKNDIVSGFGDKLEEFASEGECSEIDGAIEMLTAMKNKKGSNELNTNIEPQKKRSKRQKK